jgi:hypothetical protein
MKTGLQNRNQVIAMAALLLIAAALLLRMLASSKDAPVAASSPASSRPNGPRQASRVTERGAALAAMRASSNLDPSLRLDWLRASEETSYRGSGRNIFKSQAEPPPIPTPTHPPMGPMLPPKPPPPPPINLKFFGFASKPGQPKKIFLSQGDDIFIAGEGDIVDRRYKILHIAPASVEIEDVLNNNRQTIFLTQG